MSTAIDITQFRPASTAIQEHQPSTMALVQQAMSTGNMQLVEKLMELHERHESNLARKAFDNAMAAAKAEIKPVKKNRHVGYSHKSGDGCTDYDHEDLAGIARSIDPVLAKHGLSYRFRTEQQQQISVTCIIAHRDGHFEENKLFAPADTSGKKNAIQAIGSTITYLQRYTLKAALGLAAAKDDDGRSSSVTEEDGPITDAQVQTLIDLADEHGIDKRRFCEHFKIGGFAEIISSKFDAARMAIQKAGENRRRREAANAAAQQ